MKLSELLTDEDPRKWPKVKSKEPRWLWIQFFGKTPLGEYFGYQSDGVNYAYWTEPHIDDWQADTDDWQLYEGPENEDGYENCYLTKNNCYCGKCTKPKVKRWLWAKKQQGTKKKIGILENFFFTEEEAIDFYSYSSEILKLTWSETEFDE